MFLRQRRLKMKLSQKELGTLLGWGSGQFISNIERGLAPFPEKDIPKLAKIFKCKSGSIVDLFVDAYNEKMGRFR